MLIELYKAMAANTVTLAPMVVVIAIDTVMGVLRAIKERGFNSSVGINGAIRKAGMLFSVAAFAVIDIIVHVNLVGFIPEAIWRLVWNNAPVLGCADFFGILFIAYEIVSILKNMTLAGLPVKWVWDGVSKFLSQWTAELPKNEDEPTETPKDEDKDK